MTHGIDDDVAKVMVSYSSWSLSKNRYILRRVFFDVAFNEEDLYRLAASLLTGEFALIVPIYLMISSSCAVL